MENQSSPQSDNMPEPAIGTKKKLIVAIVVSLAIALFFFYRQSSTHKVDISSQQVVEPKLKRDEPVKEQVLQQDYKEKVKEMLDSGNSVAKVSRETGIRKDVIRKIKKEK